MKIFASCGNSFDSIDWACPRCHFFPPVSGGFPSFVDKGMAVGKAFSPEYFDRLFELETCSFWFRHRARLILKSMERYFPAPEDVLEIGCGTGFMLSEIGKRFPGTRLSGSDLFTEGLSFARTRLPDATFYQMDACNLHFEGEFDLILALDVFEHIEDDVRALSQVCRSLKPGGGLIVTVPQHKWLWSIQDEKACHKRRYARRDLIWRIKRNGFRVVRVTSFVTLLLPLMVLSRLYGQIMAKNNGDYDPVRELDIHPRINSLLGTVCAFEGIILDAGVTLPAGGSLLCLGVKEI